MIQSSADWDYGWSKKGSGAVRTAKIPRPKTFRVEFLDSTTVVLPPEFEDSWDD